MRAACTEAAPPWSTAFFGNSEARLYLLKLLLEIGELLAQGFEFPSEFRNLRFQFLDSLSIHRRESSRRRPGHFSQIRSHPAQRGVRTGRQGVTTKQVHVA